MVRQAALAVVNGTEAPLVSVIMPFLNANKTFIKIAIDSILSQDYRPLEILFVDDGSSESFDDYIRSCCTDDTVPIKVLHHDNDENKGISASRNLGIYVAEGKYVAFLDADDEWLPGKIRQQCGIMQEDETVNAVFGLTKYWFSWQDSYGADCDFVVRPGFRAQTVFDGPDYLAGMLRGRFLVPSASNLMARRDAAQACGGFEEAFRGLYEDQVFTAKLSLTGRVCAVPKLWDKYRQHADSMMARVGSYEKELAARLKFLAWLTDFCRKTGLLYPDVSEAIAKDRWLATSTFTRTGSHGYRVIRWAKKWLLRIEEHAVPAMIRRKYWLR